MIKVHYETPNNRIPPAELLQRAADSLNLDIDFELFCEPHNQPGQYNWAFDNYRLNGTYASEPKVLFYTQPGWGNNFEKQFGRYNVQCQSYAVDEDFHKPFPEEKIYDVGFIGEPHGDDRATYLELMKNNFNCFIASDVNNVELPVILSRCKVLFNHIRTEEVNIRFFENMALGVQVTTHSPALHLFAEEYKHYIAVRSPEEAVDEIKKLLQDEDRQKLIAHQAREHVVKYHTYKDRLLSMLKFVDLYE